MGKELPWLTAQLITRAFHESLNTMSNTPLVDIITANGGLVNGNNATTIQDGNIQQCVTSCNELQRISTQNNVNIPNFHAMSQADLATLAALQFEKLQRLYSIIAMPNKVYSPAEKLVLLVAPDVLARETPNERGLVCMPMPKIAERVGLSKETVARTAKNVCERTNATRDVKPYTAKGTGQSMNLVYIKKDEPVWSEPTTAEIVPEHLRNLPGDKRRVCSACGTKMQKKIRILRTQETWICPNHECGVCHVLKAENTKLDELEATIDENIEGLQRVDLASDDATIEQEPEYLEAIEALQVVDLAEEPEIITALNAYTVGGDVVSPAPAPGVQFDKIPDELKARKQFVGWKYGKLRECGKREKPLFNMRPGANNAAASVNNVLSWTDGFTAMARYVESHDPEDMWSTPYQGIGYVFMQGEGYVGLDWDNCINIIPACIDSITGQWIPPQIEWTDEQALADVLAINSYTEISPSGTGVKVITKSGIDCYVCSNPRGPEMYSDRHYFTLTGNRLDIVSHGIEAHSEPVQAIFDRVAPKIATLNTHPCVSVPCRFSDEQVLDKAMHGAYGAMFLKLWNGDASEFPRKDGKHEGGEPDYSRADYALCWELAHWTHNAEQIDRLFTQSKLYRAEKWHRAARTGETYGAGTIREVLSKKQVAS